MKKLIALLLTLTLLLGLCPMAMAAAVYADRVADYLCPNSQYTNVTYGVDPEATLTGGLKSLGDFGGSITYYFDEPLTDDPCNAYGVDFYVYGNGNEGNIASMAEPGQVWVSEDGDTWYALAGSEHYEDDVFWDYAVTYEKTEDGKTAWTDNKGNSNDGTAQCGKWIDPAVYDLNDLAKGDSFTLSGILLSARDGSICGDGTPGAFAHAVRFGYVDVYANGTVGADVNPYVETPTKANGFDLAWAVDENGLPVDVSGKEFHYVKVVTASHIWAGAFAEKSTECAGVVRTTAREAAVGKTALTGVTLTAGEQTQTVTFTPEQRVYDAEVGTAETLTLTAIGAEEGTNLYYNNHWGDGAAITLTEGKTRLVRVLAQNGEREPVSYLLRFTGSTEPPAEPEPTNPVPPQPTATVTVRFSLLGDSRHGDGTVHTLKRGGLLPWIADRAVTVPAPATVLDVITAALAREHAFTNAGGGYITAVDGLAEFDNGPRSGWMYTLNGTYPEADIARQTVQNGDRVLLHYTDDYMVEWAEAPAVVSVPAAEAPAAPVPGLPGKHEDVQKQPVTGSVTFTDTQERAVLALAARGILTGYPDGSFGAEQTVTRAEFAAMAVRALGLPTEQAAEFTDVPAAAWYAAPVGSAAAYGIVLGVGDGKFAPQGTITKQEAAVMVARAAKLCGMDTTLPESGVRSALAPFDDGGTVADWAREALAFCCRSHLLDADGLTIEPRRVVTRLEMASMLYALLESAKLL